MCAPAPLCPSQRGLCELCPSQASHVHTLAGFAFGGDRKTGTHNGEAFTRLHAGVWGDQDDEDTYATVKAALDAGINMFDNAEMYGDGYAEEVMGR
eukprot:COSAG01_NODE_31166_length_602_cov_3.856859_1_plen_95_part_01